MKQIVLQDRDFETLLDKLSLVNMQQQKELGMTSAQIHRKFHYEVVRWAQDHGAEVPRHLIGRS